MHWKKSSRSTGTGASNCVECATVTDAVLVRDSKDPDGAFLRIPNTAWRTFVADLKSYS